MRRLRLALLLLLPLLALAGVAAAAPKAVMSENPNFVTALSGDEEVPPRDTKAHGVAIFHLADDGQSMEYKLIASNIDNVVAGHIHTGTFGLNGPVVVTLVTASACITLNNGIRCEGTFDAGDFSGPLTGQPFSALLALMEQERAYVNVHTIQYPGGEIRGQIDKGGN
jgi:hypothetical protein